MVLRLVFKKIGEKFGRIEEKPYLCSGKDWKGSDMKRVGILFLFVLKKRDSNND